MVGFSESFYAIKHCILVFILTRKNIVLKVEMMKTTGRQQLVAITHAKVLLNLIAVGVSQILFILKF